MKKFILFFSLIACIFSANAQKDGYWDATRATTKEVTLPAGKKTLIVSEKLPIGTTEVAFRITSLDENQNLSNGLFSVLKAIPDPSGVSQGSAGAVLLLSQISGKDKYVYHLFSDKDKAENFVKTGTTKMACYGQSEPISKDAKLLSLVDDTCLKANKDYLYLVVESKNWMLKQKVVVEFVPWVNTKLNQGWSVANKNEVIELCKTSSLAKSMQNSDDFCICILEKFQDKFTFTEYSNLLAAEKSKAYKEFGNLCLKNPLIIQNIRSDAFQFFKEEKYDAAIKLLQNGIIDQGNATAIDYNNVAKYYLFTKQFDKAQNALNVAKSKDQSELMIEMNQAHLFVFLGKYSEAKAIHKKYRSQNINATTSWKSKALSDFEAFQKAGFSKELFTKIAKYLNE